MLQGVPLSHFDGINTHCLACAVERYLRVTCAGFFVVVVVVVEDATEEQKVTIEKSFMQ